MKKLYQIKAIILLAIVISCSPTIHAQDKGAPDKTFTPKFAKSGVEYNTLITNYGGEGAATILTTKFEGDTTLFGHQYIKVTQTDLTGFTYLDIIGYVRETEDGKVFLITERTGAEHLIYDFGLEPGESFRSEWLNSPENPTYIRLDYTTEEFIGGQMRTCYHTSSYCEKNGYWCCPVVWVEGIGSLLSPFIVEQARGFGGGAWDSYLLCYKENGELVYINEDFDDCEYGFSEDYDSEWSVMSYEYIPGTNNYASTNTLIDGNEIICYGETYTMLLNLADGECCGIYREKKDGLQIYYRQANGDGSYGEEYLMYDYSVAVGDTITAGEANVEFVVADITEVTLLNGEERKMLHLSLSSGETDEIVETWIEGIGSNYGFTSVGGSIVGGVSELLCYHEDGELLWMNPEYNTCEYMSIDEFEDTKVSVYPNPGENILNIQTSLQNARVEVYDVLGKIVYEQKIIGNSTTISTYKWTKGMYFWRVFSNEQEVENGKWIKQ